MKTVHQLSITNVQMLLLTWKIEKHIKFTTFSIYSINEIPAIFLKLRVWCTAKTPACLLHFYALKHGAFCACPVSLVSRYQYDNIYNLTKK